MIKKDSSAPVRTPKVSIKLTAKQKDVLLSPATEIFFGGAAGPGKMVSLSEHLPTPNGWVQMGDIKVGDVIFTENGDTCRVIYLHPIDKNPVSYRLTFSDGSQIKCCKDHLWHTYTAHDLAALTKCTPEYRARRRANRPSRATGRKPHVAIWNSKRNYDDKLKTPTGNIRTTQEIYETLYVRNGTRANHAIPVAKPLNLPEAILPLDPYCLGAWLGDGHKNGGGFTGVDPEIWEAFEAQGYHVTHRKDGKGHHIHKMIREIRKAGVFNNKHIPQNYLRASIEQRLALLQGLMDTDGTVDRGDGSVAFTNTNKALVDGVYELIVSLGMKARVIEGRAKLDGKDCGPLWDICWVANVPVFRLKRKLDRQKIATRRTTKFRYIVACEPIAPIPMRCITVSNPTGMFLIGKSMIPTHNSFLLRAAAIFYCTKIPHLQVYLLRRLSPDLKKNHLEGVTGLRNLLEPWIQANLASVTESGARFWNGAAIHLGHCEEEKDKYKYQGPEINMLLIDELTHFTESQYRFIRGRVRLGSLRSTIPDEYRDKFPLIITASNPGNIGHEWVKRTFIDECQPDGTPIRMKKSEGGKIRAFFAALMTDNPYIDPDYADTLEGLGSADLVKAMKDGDWNVLQGAFFSEFSTHKHMIEPFKVPVHWTRVMAMDWGFWYPFSIGWWAIAEEDFAHPITGRMIPLGTKVCYRQWYGTQKDGSNLGLSMDPEEVAKEIKKIEAAADGEPDYRVADPECWKSDQKMTVAALFAKKGVRFLQADNTHATGYIELKRALKNGDILWFDTCTNAARNFSNAVRDDRDPSEIAKNCEVHAADEARYLVMAVKRGLKSTARREPMEINTDLTYGAMIKYADEFELREKGRRGPLEC